MHGSKPALAVFWSTARVWVLTSLNLSAEGQAVLSSSKTLARTFAAAFPVTAPLVVCSVALPCSELFSLCEFVSCQSFWESLSMLRDAVFMFELDWACACFGLNQPPAGSVLPRSVELGFSPFPLWPNLVPCRPSPGFCSTMGFSPTVLE